MILTNGKIGWYQIFLFINIWNIWSICLFTNNWNTVWVFGSDAFGFRLSLFCNVQGQGRKKETWAYSTVLVISAKQNLRRVKSDTILIYYCTQNISPSGCSSLNGLLMVDICDCTNSIYIAFQLYLFQV